MAHSEPYVQKTMFLFLCYGNLTLNRKIKIIAICFFFLGHTIKSQNIIKRSNAKNNLLHLCYNCHNV